MFFQARTSDFYPRLTRYKNSESWILLLCPSQIYEHFSKAHAHQHTHRVNIVSCNSEIFRMVKTADNKGLIGQEIVLILHSY